MVRPCRQASQAAVRHWNLRWIGFRQDHCGQKNHRTVGDAMGDCSVYGFLLQGEIISTSSFLIFRLYLCSLCLGSEC